MMTITMMRMINKTAAGVTTAETMIVDSWKPVVPATVDRKSDYGLNTTQFCDDMYLVMLFY